MSSPKLRLGLAAVIFILAVGLLIASLLPAPHVQQVLPMPSVVPTLYVLPTPVIYSTLWGAA